MSTKAYRELVRATAQKKLNEEFSKLGTSKEVDPMIAVRKALQDVRRKLNRAIEQIDEILL